MTAALRLGDAGLIQEHLDGSSQQMISALIALFQEGDSLPARDSRKNDSDYCLERLDKSDYMVRLRTGERLIYAGGRLQIR